MKYLAAILAIIVLTLSCIPCTDGEEVHVAHEATHNHTAGTHDHAHKHDHDSHEEGHIETCSPLCQCACCAIACNVPPNVLITPSNEPSVFIPVFSNYKTQHAGGISSAIWQPPRMA